MNNGGTETADSTMFTTGTKIESWLCRPAEEHYGHEQLVLKWQMKFRVGYCKVVHIITKPDKDRPGTK